jgi:FAD/FMN-containing dehydrogenase
MSRSASLPAGVVSFEPDELIVRVLAGTTMRDLAGVLAASGQRLRIPAVGTVGGAVSARRNGPYPPDNAALPNIVLRLRAIDGAGREFIAGGGTVKNVSGFDLLKVLVGSRGMLATILEVTFRTEPIPRASRWFSGTGPVDGLFRPALVAQRDGFTIVNLEGHPDDVIEQAALLDGFVETLCPTPEQIRELEPVGKTSSAGLDDPATLAVCRRLKESFDPENRLATELSLALGLA